MGKTGRGRRRRVETTGDWGQIELLCGWPEQRDYELIRPIVLFGSPAAERASETGAASERTLQRRAKRFEAEGVESLFGSERAKQRGLPPLLAARQPLDLHKMSVPTAMGRGPRLPRPSL